MAKKLSSVLGVDIGSQNIKIAEVKVTGGKPTVTALGMALTPEGAVDHIGIHDPDSVGNILKQLCSSTGATVSDVVVSIAGQGSVLVRTLEVPAMNDSELKQHMDWEITRNIPFAESTVVSDYKAFPPSPNNPQNMDVVMAISPQSAIDSIVSMVKKTGRKPAAIDVEPLGIARSLQTSYGDSFAGRSVCVIHIGHKTTAINVYKDGKLMMPRQVPIGGEMMTRAISDGLGVSSEEAERLKTDVASVPSSPMAPAATFNPFDTGAATQSFTPYNPFAEPEEAGAEAAAEPAPAPAEAAPEPAAPVVSDSESGRVYNAMAGVLDEFVAEVRRSIDYYRSKGGDVDLMLICGGGARLRGLAEFLHNAIGLSCQVMDPLKGVTISAKKLDNFREEDRQEYAVALGNGLHICY
ncbi:MAG: type IV pilus assembly protein PilM [Armatimonadetes bacterium]|nr:type IV pilus assembly protein PilM [Armatimonadota bacterium]